MREDVGPITPRYLSRTIYYVIASSEPAFKKISRSGRDSEKSIRRRIARDGRKERGDGLEKSERDKRRERERKFDLGAGVRFGEGGGGGGGGVEAEQA